MSIQATQMKAFVQELVSLVGEISSEKGVGRHRCHYEADSRKWSTLKACLPYRLIQESCNPYPNPGTLIPVDLQKVWLRGTFLLLR